MKKQLLVIAILMSLVSLTACEQATNVFGKKVKCGDESSQQAVKDLFKKEVQDISSKKVKDLIVEENITVDMSKMRASFEKIDVKIEDIRTDSSDPNSKKEHCKANLVLTIPDNLIQDANKSRESQDLQNILQMAILADIETEQSKFKKEISYVVQPTDDGKKIYTTMDKNSLIEFTSTVVLDAILKTERENQMQQIMQEQAQAEAEENQAQQEYNIVLVQEAQNNIDMANAAINVVWQATTPEIRKQLLPEQRLWLKKRELECKLKATQSGDDNPEAVRLNCEAEMTKQRTNVLRTEIANLESYN